MIKDHGTLIAIAQWTKKPLIAGALDAVAHADVWRSLVTASFHVARRVHFPGCFVSLDGEHFFAQVALDRRYRHATLFLETLLKDEPFLS